jgi:hypothetical protein
VRVARITGGTGVSCVLLAGALLFTGFTPVRLLISVIASVLAVVLLAVTFVLVRKETAAPVGAGVRSPGSRQVVPCAVASAGLGIVAAVVAIAVAEGEAQAHATGHLVMGLVCLSLFAVLGFWWRPLVDSSVSAFRGLLLALLWLAAAAAFLESLGGSGYDAVNSGRRIGFLVSLHGYTAPFGALFMLAVPLGALTLATLGMARAVLRLRLRLRGTSPRDEPS